MADAEAWSAGPTTDGPGPSAGSGLAEDLARGVLRLLGDMGYEGSSEVHLANGRRADVMAVNGKGRVVIVEIKTSAEDFRADKKWHSYLEYCDGFYFCVPAEFPMDMMPGDQGLMIADRYGGSVVRHGPETRIAAARRKALILRLARITARRLRAESRRSWRWKNWG